MWKFIAVLALGALGYYVYDNWAPGALKAGRTARRLVVASAKQEKIAAAYQDAVVAFNDLGEMAITTQKSGRCVTTTYDRDGRPVGNLVIINGFSAPVNPSTNGGGAGTSTPK